MARAFANLTTKTQILQPSTPAPPLRGDAPPNAPKRTTRLQNDAPKHPTHYKSPPKNRRHERLRARCDALHLRLVGFGRAARDVLHLVGAPHRRLLQLAADLPRLVVNTRRAAAPFHPQTKISSSKTADKSSRRLPAPGCWLSPGPTRWQPERFRPPHTQH